MLSLVAGLYTGIIPFQTNTVKATEFFGEVTAYSWQKYSDLDTVINDGSYTGISSTFLDPKQPNFEAIWNLTTVY